MVVFGEVQPQFGNSDEALQRRVSMSIGKLYGERKWWKNWVLLQAQVSCQRY